MGMSLVYFFGFVIGPVNSLFLGIFGTSIGILVHIGLVLSQHRITQAKKVLEWISQVWNFKGK